MGSEIVDDIKKLIKELRYMHGLGWYGSNGQAADALERLSAENADLRARLEQAERERDEARAKRAAGEALFAALGKETTPNG